MLGYAGNKIVNGLTAAVFINGVILSAFAYGASPEYENRPGGVFGAVTDISCRVSLNGKSASGNGDIWLAPISLTEIHSRAAGIFMKPQAFTLQLSHCGLISGRGDMISQQTLRNISARWVDGSLIDSANNERSGYLANTLSDGAAHVYLALSTNDNNTLDESNKIIPADPSQNQVRMQRSAADEVTFTYYIGYVTHMPAQATSGPIISRATWELVYN
ncbi:type 1 fimbrial protein [Brenneria populi]|uniref:Type 1 fimbrial protein n=1 Tax=Brenneria populi TaxID=1505588 RepID=A0ABU6JTS6_9GAMM|nr:type 1 fimbrial protein [Brenneria populi Li et al. 2015]